MRRLIGSLFAFRIEAALTAILFCSAVSAFVGGCAFAYGMATSNDLHSGAFGLAVSRIVMATSAGFLALVPAGFLLAVPTTWLGDRLRLESAIYYLLTGTIAGAACSLALMGLPKQDEFFVQQIIRMTGPVFGASWAFLWWVTHRRWRQGAK